MINLRQRHMRVFREVMRAGSITRAAKHLNLTQPAVSRTLIELEKLVGFSLFRRIGGHTTPTVEAHTLLEEFDQLLLHHDLVGARIEAVRERSQGSLTIAAPPGLLSALIARASARFYVRHEDIRMMVEAHPLTTIMDLVIRQEVDLGFVYSPLDLSKVKSIPLCRSEIVCAFKADHKLAAKRVITPADIGSERIVTISNKIVTGMLVLETLQPEQLSRIIETNTSAVAVAMIAEGGGIGLVDAISLVRPAEGLAFARFKPQIEFRMFAIHSRFRPPSRIAVDFLNDLMKTISEVARTTSSIQPMGGASR
jgi:DNA-binding transcriptional LysR family regulator